MHDIKIIADEISLLIRKLLENTSPSRIIGRTKTRKLLLTRMRAKHNIIVLQYHIIQFFTRWYRWWNISFHSIRKKVFYILSTLLIHWQEPPMTIQKMLYHHLLRWRPCYFSYSMNMLIFHACSNQKPFHTQENYW
jgi:hypothetical protein